MFLVRSLCRGLVSPPFLCRTNVFIYGWDRRLRETDVMGRKSEKCARRKAEDGEDKGLGTSHAFLPFSVTTRASRMCCCFCGWRPYFPSFFQSRPQKTGAGRHNEGIHLPSDFPYRFPCDSYYYYCNYNMEGQREEREDWRHCMCCSYDLHFVMLKGGHYAMFNGHSKWLQDGAVVILSLF